MTKKFYITTAIPYVNAEPHIGFSLEIVQTDTIARYHRFLGEDVYFLTGSDENALKNVQAAEEQGILVKKLVDKNSDKFYQLKDALNLSFDDFIRTTEKRHIEGAQALWKACKKEDIYKKKYKGLYCVGCEVFLTEKDLVDGKCPEHKNKPEVVEEENYFFRLSKYQDWLEKLITTNELKIIPRTRKNEVLAFIRQGLEDLSISRTRERAHGWGIPVPGDPNQIIYVWFDALANYITALDWQHKGKLYQKYWPADVHVIGKGITRFHAIYWPAMLKSAGIPLPKTEFVHGYITVEGEKISKSLGNVIDPFDLVKKYGTDPIRYYLLREIPAYGDGDFSIQRFKEVYNANLANGLGNLVARVAKLCEKSSSNFKATKSQIYPQVKQSLNKFLFDEALSFVWKEISVCDRVIDREKPWELSNKKLKTVLEKLVKEIRQISYNLQPFLPETAEKIEKQVKGPKIKSEKPLFPRLK
ncbi:methionine--tRNA ligase [Patescibacteria group bacterium]|nr:methionine--tRNA ligase [Patescibacteria group bacterium]